MKNRILLLESNRVTRNFTKLALEKEGYKVLTASTIEEARELFKHDNYQVHILDLTITDGDGLELFRKMKEEKPISYYIATVSRKVEFSFGECRKLGFDDYFVKPFSFRELLKALKRIMECIGRITQNLEHESWSGV